MIRNPALGADVVLSGRFTDLFVVESAGLLAFLGVWEKRLGVFCLLASGTSGRRLRRANGTDDLVPGAFDPGLGRKLNGRKLCSGLFDTVIDPSSNSSSSSTSNFRLEVGEAVACSLGRTEEGDTLLGPPGNTEDRVPPNWKPPGLLVANLNPGELFPILDEPNWAPGREEPG